MDTDAQLNRKRMILWILVTMVFVVLVAYLSAPPCDKPVCRNNDSRAGRASVPEETTEPEFWTTAEGISVSFLYRPSFNRLSVQLMIEPETTEENNQLQTVHSFVLPSLTAEDNGVLLDKDQIRKALSSQIITGSPSRIRVSLEGSISREQARQLSEVVSQGLHQSQRALNSSPRE